jgi:hypothetical protein
MAPADSRALFFCALLFLRDAEGGRAIQSAFIAIAAVTS